jgi:5-methyltetrahydrofolate--homocysteine methyltransferase
MEAEKQADSDVPPAKGRILHGHRQGRRARHRQEHRGRGAGLQRLRSDRPRRHGPSREDPGQSRPRAAGGLHRPQRPHHPVAGRNGPRGPRTWSGRVFNVPLLIGGATTSKAHTAVKIAPPPLGLHIWDNIDLRELASYIDWSPFFWTWELKGKFPDILNSEKYGQQARELHADALRLLEDIITNHRVQPRAVTAIARAFADGDDIHIQHGHNGSTDTLTFHFLRQQARKERYDRPYVSLADFVPPEHADAPGLLGGFALTAGHEIEDYAAHFRNKGDDYTAILIQALADRIAEACAEMIHKHLRDQWGIATHEPFRAGQPISQDDNRWLIDEQYLADPIPIKCIRPAAGYPCCPDHTEKATLWRWLQADRHTGCTLTENFAMNPPASVSGLYLAHPRARYFHIGKIGRDQLEDYAARKGWTVQEAEKWLRPNLA